jgi:hypothetical protein
MNSLLGRFLPSGVALAAAFAQVSWFPKCVDALSTLLTLLRCECVGYLSSLLGRDLPGVALVAAFAEVSHKIG